MSHGKRYAILAGLAVALAAGGLVAYFSADSRAREKPAAKGPAAAPVAVVAALQQSVPVRLQAIGNVEAYTLVDLSASYKFNKMTSLTIGVKNLFDKDPPFSNQSNRSQRGYDPRYTDPLGRALFVRAAYGF